MKALTEKYWNELHCFKNQFSISVKCTVHCGIIFCDTALTLQAEWKTFLMKTQSFPKRSKNAFSLQSIL